MPALTVRGLRALSAAYSVCSLPHGRGVADQGICGQSVPLLDVNDVALGHSTIMRWNDRAR